MRVQRGVISYSIAAMHLVGMRRIATARARATLVVHHRPLSLYSHGDGLYGGLGHGDAEKYALPTRVEALKETQLASIAAGWAHSAAATASGEVLVWGQPFELKNVLRLRRTASTSGRGLASLIRGMNLWMSPDPTDVPGGSVPTPTLMKGLPVGEVVVAVSCGAGLTAARCASGALYLFGLNGYGQCGSGAETGTEFSPVRALGGLDPTPPPPPGTPRPTPTTARKKVKQAEAARLAARALPPRAALGQGVVDVALGFQHGACVTAAGAVLTWGKGERGQLGTGGRENASSPARCPLVPDPLGHPLGVHPDDGSGLEPGPYVPDALRRFQCAPAPGAPRAVRVGCGFNHTACLDAEGGVHVWGKMQGTAVASGRGDGSGGGGGGSASGGGASGGDVSGAGGGGSMFMSLLSTLSGVATYEDQLVPRRLELPGGATDRAVDVACSAFHTALLLADGTVLACGMRLGSRETVPQPVPLLVPVAAVRPQRGGGGGGGSEGGRERSDGSGGAGDSEGVGEVLEVSAALALVGETVVAIRGGPAANSTAVLTSGGRCLHVFFAAHCKGSGVNGGMDGDGLVGGGSAPSVPAAALSGCLAEPWAPPPRGGGISGGSGGGAAARVEDAALGWQHGLVLVK